MVEPSNLVLAEAIKEKIATADLDTLSSKKIRKELEEKYSVDLTEKKKEIDQMVMDAIENLQKEKEKNGKAEVSSPNGESSSSKKDDADGSSSSEELEPDSDDGEPKKKKKKAARGSSSEPDDESIARELQEEERGTRHRAAKAEKKTRKEKPKSDKPSKRKGTSTYSQECFLSEELAAVMGTDRMARKDVVKGMWAIFKERELQDPRNKQFVNCDEQLQKVFKVKRFKAFGMMKILKNHIKDARLVSDG